MTDTAWEPLRDLPRGTAGLERAARAIRQASSRHTSVYLYGLEGDTLVIRAFSGRPTEHTRIRVGEGVCGRAVASGVSQVVSDVAGDPDYISCSLETRSECVVLVVKGRETGTRAVTKLALKEAIELALTRGAASSPSAATRRRAPGCPWSAAGPSAPGP